MTRAVLSTERPRALRVGIWVTLFIGFSKHLTGIPLLRPLIGLAAAGLQLFIPLREADRSSLGDDGIGYTLQGFRQDAVWVAAIFLLTALPFWFLHEYWWAWIQNRPAGSSALGLPVGDLSRWLEGQAWITGTLPAVDLIELVLIHLLAVALPEELFYRGYLQPRLCASFDDKALAFGFRWNHGIALTAALFAMAHFLGDYNPARLGPFFPALLFGLLRRRSGGIGGAVLLHGLYNILGAMLFAGMGE